MYIQGKIGIGLEPYAERLKALLQSVLSALDLSPGSLLVPAESTLYSHASRDNTLFVIRDGILKFVSFDKLIYLVEPGDMLGLEGSLEHTAADYQSEFAVRVDVYNRAEFFEAVRADAGISSLWAAYQTELFAALMYVTAHAVKDEALFSPEIRTFDAGDILVEQGTEGQEVYTLIDGRAEVFVDGVMVGEVLKDEIFGAVAMITNKTRIATVRAATDCMAVVLAREQFFKLIESRPDTMLKLVEDLSRAIVALNQRVIGYGKVPE